MKNRYIYLLVGIIILLAVVLPSCGGGDKTSSPTTSKTAVATTSPAKTTAPTTTAGSDVNLAEILGKSDNINSIKYNMTITVTGSPVISGVVYQKDDMMRYEVTIQDTETVMLFNMADSIMYIYLPSQKMAMKETLDPGDEPEGNVGNSSDILKLNPVITGNDIIDGKDCIIIKYNEPVSGDVKMWVWKDKGFPLKMEITTPAGLTTIAFNDFEFPDIPDSMFQLPDDVLITSSGTSST
jgi:outer membrane lipoprotein-sorting protein